MENFIKERIITTDQIHEGFNNLSKENMKEENGGFHMVIHYKIYKE